MEVSYKTEAGEEETLTTTPEHPFWSEEAQGFVPAQELQRGESLRTVHNEVARVIKTTPRRGPPITVYNFAVAEHHTYFVGEGRVWVHNLCKVALDRYASNFQAIFDTKIAETGGDTVTSWRQAMDEISNVARKEELSSTKFMEVME